MHYWFEQMRRWKTSPTRPQQRRGISWWFPPTRFSNFIFQTIAGVDYTPTGMARSKKISQAAADLPVVGIRVGGTRRGDQLFLQNGGLSSSLPTAGATQA